MWRTGRSPVTFFKRAGTARAEAFHSNYYDASGLMISLIESARELVPRVTMTLYSRDPFVLNQEQTARQL
jgi:hypothetical protein